VLFQFGLVCGTWLFAAGLLRFSAFASERPSTAIRRDTHANARFVFADLDGDQKPDLALVEWESQRSSKTSYSVRVKLSQGAESAIGVDGPFGGLRVTARDVNGDDKLDLIVTSNLDSGFIKVLLNDGHGNFTVAAPGDFSGLEDTDNTILHGPAGPQADRVTLASARSSLEDGIVRACDLRHVFSSAAHPLSDARPALKQVVRSPLGRSPPASVALS
jgi:hypothetical protein